MTCPSFLVYDSDIHPGPVFGGQVTTVFDSVVV